MVLLRKMLVRTGSIKGIIIGCVIGLTGLLCVVSAFTDWLAWLDLLATSVWMVVGSFGILFSILGIFLVHKYWIRYHEGSILDEIQQNWVEL